MKIKRVKKINFYLVSVLLLVALFSIYLITNNSLQKNKNLKNLPTLDTPDYYPVDSAIPFYNLKWLDNLKYDIKGILTEANVQTVNEGKITRISFEHGEINVDKKANLNYPFVVRIELSNPVNNKKEVLFFSSVRYEKAQIFRTGENGELNKVGWEDIKAGDTASIEENIDLLISNTDGKKKFTDNYVKSLIIILK